MEEIANTEEFNQAIAKGTVVADFNADWCGPCQAMASVLEDFADGVKIISVNIDILPELAEKYEVSSIPCLIKFVDGTEAGRSIGLVSKRKLAKFLGAV